MNYWVCYLKTLVRVEGVGGVIIIVCVGFLMMIAIMYMSSIKVWCVMWAEDELCHGMVEVNSMR